MTRRSNSYLDSSIKLRAQLMEAEIEITLLTDSRDNWKRLAYQMLCFIAIFAGTILMLAYIGVL